MKRILIIGAGIAALVLTGCGPVYTARGEFISCPDAQPKISPSSQVEIWGGAWQATLKRKSRWVYTWHVAGMGQTSNQIDLQINSAGPYWYEPTRVLYHGLGAVIRLPGC